MCARRRGLVSLVAAVVLTLSACTRDSTPPPPPATSESPASAPPTQRVVGPLSPEDARALASMNDRLREYVDLDHFYERVKTEKGIAYFVAESGGQLRKGNIDQGSGITARGFDTDLAFMPAEIAGDEM